jgi:PAS domain S-box-containing protein
MGILVTDGSGGIITINPFALKEFGYSEEELIGKNVEILTPRRFYDKYIHHGESMLKIRKSGQW